MKLFKGPALAGAAAMLAAQTAAAHPMAFHAGGFAAGFAHPFLGIDHILAMIAIGVWAAQCGGRARMALPLSAVAAILAGGVLATTGLALPNVDAGIAATVLAMGLLIALAVRLPLWAGASAVALFAMWHGYAHGAEMPATADRLFYATGFVAASTMLVAAGLYAGRWIVARAPRAQAVGACIAAAGALFIAAA